MPFPDLEQTCKEAACLIAKSKVIGWYRGRMEVGPVLWAIAAFLLTPVIRNTRLDQCHGQNARSVPTFWSRSYHQTNGPMVRRRTGTDLPFMIMKVNVREAYRAKLPAITHVNGSARIQTVDGLHKPGVPPAPDCGRTNYRREMLLNTSFNVIGAA
jgi:carbamoyltransferase